MTLTDTPTLPGGIPAYGTIDVTAFPVYVTNTGPFPLTWRYDGKAYSLPNDGQRHVVSYMAMVRHMGDPRAIDIDAKRRHRHDEYKRLRNLYGVFEHDELWRTATSKCACSKADGGEFSSCSGHLPAVKAFGFDGEQIITVLDDPEGNSITPATPGTVAEETFLRESVQALSAQLQIQAAQLKELQSQNAALIGGDPVDLGEQGTTEKVIGPEAAPEPAPAPVSKPRGKAAGQGAATVTMDDA